MEATRVGNWVALVIVGIFVIASLVALFAEESLPSQSYPLVTIALGYLLGFQVHKNGKAG